MMAQKHCEKTVKIVNKLGLHARPAAMFVELASKFKAHISVRKDSNEVNGKSIMGIMMLAAANDTVVQIIANGEDAREALDALAALINEKFNEE